MVSSLKINSLIFSCRVIKFDRVLKLNLTVVTKHAVEFVLAIHEKFRGVGGCW